MEQQWHDILLHNDAGDAALHKGAPLLLEALQIIGDVQSISAATRLGLHLREAEHSSAMDQLVSTFTDKHMHREHAAHAAAAAPLLKALVDFLQGCTPAPETAAAAAAPMTPSLVAVAELDGLLVPSAVWRAGSREVAVPPQPQLPSSPPAEAAASPSPGDAVIPLAGELRWHPLFSYKAFLDRLDRLSGLISNGEVFSACEPRIKVLQSRFSLYRAYNGGREDAYHPTFGGGDIKRAPKCDLRRVETCVSAASVVKFIEELRRDRPSYPLYTEDIIGEARAKGVTSDDSDSSTASDTVSHISIKEAVRRFFGSSVAKSERVLTEEGLCLRPSYAADSPDRWLSLQQLADSGDNPRAAHSSRLLRPLLSTSGGADGEGELLALLLQPILTRVLTSGTCYDRLELELTVSGKDVEELPRLARWCAMSGLLQSCPGLFFRFHVVQDAYIAGTEAAQQQRRHHSQHATVVEGHGSSSESSSRASRSLFFGDVLHNIFSPIWEAYLAAAGAAAGTVGSGADAPGPSTERRVAEMQALLRRTTGFSVSLTNAAAVQEMPPTSNPSCQFPLPSSNNSGGSERATAAASLTPPDAFFVYHIWRNVQLVNAFVFASGEQEKRTTGAVAACEAAGAAMPAWNIRPAFTLTLHGGANSRTLFGESVLGLLLADAVVNPSAAFEWSPLTYLFMLSQRHIILTPSRNRCSSASVKHTLNTTAVPLAVQAGLHVSVATLDPLFYDTTNDALSEELKELAKQRGLANADVTEMCLRSLEASSGCFTRVEQRHLFGYAWPHAQARYSQFSATQVSPLRLHHRACALEHELDVLFAAVREGSNNSGGGVATTTARRRAVYSRRDEARLRAVLFLPSAADDGSDPSAAVYRRTISASTRALELEHDPALLVRLPGYQAHEGAMQYPRILISGPDRVGPSAAAKRLMVAMATREAYQQFVMRPEYAQRMQTGSPYGPDRKKDSQSHSPEALVLKWRDGVLNLEERRPKQHSSHAGSASASSPSALPTWVQFQKDTRMLRRLASADPTVAKYASKRLDMLESKYKLHVALTNDDEEDYTITAATATAAENTEGDSAEARARAAAMSRRCVVQTARGDAHNCVKVDVHCHMASGMTAKSLLQFMQRKIRDHPDDVVGVDSRTGAPITLVEFFDEILGEQLTPKLSAVAQGDNSTAVRRAAQGFAVESDKVVAAASAKVGRVAHLLAEMPVAALQVHAGKATFHRFDRFNHRFSPMGMASLRSLFLKTENFMQGRYFAELIRDSFKQNELEGGTFTENRLSIYGRHKDEWDRLSRWFVLHGVSHRTNSWMIQVPRLFHLYQRSGQLRSFQEMLTNIFEPLWHASLHPDKYPYLHFFLSHVSGFDSVDNESDREPDQTIDIPPAQWTSAENPPFAYYMFYMWINITTLNLYRAARGFNTFQFRPHAGESGDPDHMADVFLLADGIGHGVNLDKRPVMQYLYYLAQIPLAITPMSNNTLFCRYKDHPLPNFLYRGLNVAIGTDCPLIFHRTEQPLLEEYGTAEALWNLSAADICELAANSVRTSGFPVSRKREWLGPLYYLRSVAGNDVARSHVPQTRCAFRYEAYMEEVTYLQNRAACEMSCRAMRTPLEEEVDIMDAVGISRGELLERRWDGAEIEEKQRGRPLLPASVDERPARVAKTRDVSHL
ncbi:amp deaminase-like protein [Leishmania mexicana MHOM/GT/2001/U1103]|uniref:AMP deaminase n=1 Tax=Leishmania mexicana (strain MHOM/GT/2001/U1103) TaxID=929439 RepID=E9APC2_LEIMU|nr:amp deaminase-like protein [Leishmania mexicana MHOM/GT/2001/U1103]CBZ24786.1 amp deaminase-like protein [Leishmania mexicana MHOM/GT/2001/U1103]